MSFALPLRSFGRHAVGQSPLSSLRLQIGTTARGFSHKPAAGAATTIATTFPRVNSSSPSSSLSRFTWAAPFALLAAYSLLDYNSRPLFMEPQRETTKPTTVGTSPPFSSASSDTGIPYRGEMPKSDVNVYNLGFGTVCGICSGIFIKKGAKFIAFLLGGGFVLLQYLNTQRIITINWRSLSSRYDSVVSKAAGQGDAVSVNKPAASGWTDSTAARIWNRSIHFLTADFPSRGTFVAGLLLGLRLG